MERLRRAMATHQRVAVELSTDDLRELVAALERAQPHATRYQTALGDTYALCACGAISRPYESLRAASEWRCPMEAAERDVSSRRREWEERVRRAVESGDIETFMKRITGEEPVCR